MTATTELEAVNIMLAAIGEAPVNSLSGTLPVDVSLAQNTLTEVNKEVQSEGWSFNTEIDVELTRDGSNHISLSTNVLRADPNIHDHPSVDAIQIALKLYDRKKHTYEFDENLKCIVVYLRPFTDIPEPARRYVNIKAARIYVDRMVGDESLRTFTQQDEIKARSVLMETDFNNADHNILIGDPSLTSVFSTYSPANALIR
tara:strand:+ start:443 stop:1045 length:603 start_codon:yes stop_codon:yes gene_type:complete